MDSFFAFSVALQIGLRYRWASNEMFRMNAFKIRFRHTHAYTYISREKNASSFIRSWFWLRVPRLSDLVEKNANEMWIHRVKEEKKTMTECKKKWKKKKKREKEKIEFLINSSSGNSMRCYSFCYLSLTEKLSQTRESLLRCLRLVGRHLLFWSTNRK